MHRLLEIRPEYLSRLKSGESVNVFRKLLLAEAHRLGIPAGSINVPLSENVSDGGIDASVDTSENIKEGELIQRGSCRYQIKSGKNFKPHQKAMLRKELFGRGKKELLENLAPGIRDCLKLKGFYVIICFGIELTHQQTEQAKEHLLDFFYKCGFKNARCLVLPQNKLISIFESYPSLVRILCGYRDAPFEDYELWSKRVDMRYNFISSDSRTAHIREIRDVLSNSENFHIRISGEPGVGKTRVLLEALREEYLSCRVVYIDRPILFMESAAFREILEDDRMRAIVILDDCDGKTLLRFIKLLTASAIERIKLISISQEKDKIGKCISIDVPPLRDDEIMEIINKNHKIPKNHLRRSVELCSGSPQAAHILGENIHLDSKNMHDPFAIDNVWENYLLGDRSAGDPKNDITLRVLRHIALFKKFGFGISIHEEAEIIAKLITDKHPVIGKGDFQEIIRELCNRRILKGSSTLHITPKALHIWLWLDWFEVYGTEFDLGQFLEKLTDSLLEWFSEMFRYAATSDIAKRCVDQQVGINGSFQRDKGLLCSEHGSRIFLSMTEASPESCLRCLEMTIGQWSEDNLRKFITGRRNIIFALERIVVWCHLFQRGARLLLALAEAENETYCNNASGVFVGLFSPATGKVSPTEASPEERFPILKEAVESESQARRQLGLQACSNALDTGTHSRMEGAEIQGLHEEAELWNPETLDEYLQSYERVFRYIVERVANLEKSERDFVGEIVLKRARGLLRSPPPLPDLCISALKDFFAEGIIDKTSVWGVLDDVLEYDVDVLQPSIRTILESMQNEMVDMTFSGRLHRFVGRNRWKDHIDPDKDRYLDELVRESLENSNAFMQECPWLVTREAWVGDLFGYRLGIADEESKLLDPIIAAQDAVCEEESSLAFLAGYLGALFIRDRERWDGFIDDWAVDESRKSWIPDIIWRCKFDDMVAERVTSLIRENGISWRILGQLRYSPHFQKLPEEIIVDWFDILSSSSPESDAARIAVGLLYAYYERGDEKRYMPLDLGKRVLLNPILMESGEHKDDLLEHQWFQAGKTFVDQYPDECPSILDFLIQDSINGDMFMGRYDREGYEFARNLISSHPSSCWSVIEYELNRENKIHTYKVMKWIAGGYFNDDDRGIWSVLPVDMLLQWIDQDVGERVLLVAEFAPNKIEKEGVDSIIYELIIRYGDRDDVSRVLMSRFTGRLLRRNASDHYRNEQEKFRLLLSQHDEPKICAWIDKMISHLDGWIENSKIIEERWD